MRTINRLLGGMRALPTGPWTDSPPALADAPVAAEWTLRNASVRHVFTHFELVAALATATIGSHIDVAEGEWWPIADLESAGLPTLFAKAVKAIGRSE